MPEIRREIRFLLGREAEAVRLSDVAPSDTLLDFLRLDRRLTGTKEGCAEGDCGACTVLVGRLDGPPDEERLVYEPVCACIRFLASLDATHVVTVEHLEGPDGGPTPVQRAMVEHHGSQCGFCTPGIVTALHALWIETPRPEPATVEAALSGNLCRCTGYAPILRAADAAHRYGRPEDDPLVTAREAVAARLRAMRDGVRVEVARGGARAVLPADAEDLATVLEAEPQATIVAGATDVGLWVTKRFRDIAPAIFVGHLADLRRIEADEREIRLGAGVTYAQATKTLLAAFPHLADYWSRIAGWQVRAMGTIGGNIANGSPIGDTPPVLIALGARLRLRRGGTRREIALEDFFLDYGRQDRAPGEFVESVRVPKTRPGRIDAAYKVSKRRDDDISAVAAGFSLEIEDGTVAAARLAYGGMAATPRRARAAEAALTGRPFDAAAVEAAAAALAQDFSPISDHRASAGYRLRVAGNLLRRLHAEHAGEPVRLAPA